MAVWALGLNHNTAPLDLRGRFAFALEQLGPTLSALRRSVAHDNGEIAILSTCNRTEIYGVGESAQIQQTLAWLAESGGVSPEALQKYTYALHETEAWRQAELARARKLLTKGEDIEQVLEALSKGLTQKMLHGAMAELHSGDADHRERARHAIEHFFLRGNR